jgi:hypothetical protein
MRNWMNAWSSLKYNSNCVFWIAIVSMSCVTLWRSWGVRMRDSFNCWLKYSKVNESLKKFFVVFTNYKKARVCVCVWIDKKEILSTVQCVMFLRERFFEIFLLFK